jgi:hypothetical protein
MDDGKLTLRSYRLAFQLERRLHRVDRFRIPVPYGIPLTALAYAAATFMLVLALGPVPVAGPLLAALPLPIRWVLLPGLGAHLLCRTRSDGRPAHEALAAWLVFRLGPRHLVALGHVQRVQHYELDLIAVATDERTASYPPGQVPGPATVLLRQPARLTVSRGDARLRQLEDRPMSRPRQLDLAAGQRLVIE